MSEFDDDYDAMRQKARGKVDDAVREYCATLYADDPDVMGCGGWVLSTFGAHTDPSSSAYLTECAPGQPFHSTLGLIRYASLFYERDDS